MRRQPPEPRTNGEREPILVIESDRDLGQAIVDQLVADDHPAKLALSANHATVHHRTARNCSPWTDDWQGMLRWILRSASP